ncbi:N5-glutamine S-adenosyl-L-methionine-dependent methyltransferase [Spiroplasma syrphidicola EA-1]|uniref:Release factor glutamine methyltransferase n=1 Tax=Spiroplasma syrphidicola EA-1 TaxID=1276229 RepID=R4U2Q4_9MOLU|nr:peptide chain release factor N(5)-glutamine methyltransferase [Spiroplasma syrphidicola]AGM25632.1 N5-glutamine S-adenosyl-L-methionine-dependent methyltransferase [Spiroplasma syrphidicola EA-1]
MTIRELIKKTEAELSEVAIPNFISDIKALVAFSLQTSLAQLYAMQEDEVNFNLEQYWALISEYKNGKPLQQITNRQYFYGNEFYVDSNVLIPRYETEELVDYINVIIDDRKTKKPGPLTLIDIGTGSGAIAISIGLENPDLKIYASDISEPALRVTQKNLTKLECQNVELLQGNMLEPFIKEKIKADILVCNPPYIPKQQKISARVKDYEPHVALFGGEDGLFFYHEIFKNWEKVMKEDGILCFEHGYDQKRQLEKLVRDYFPKKKYKFTKDVNKKWRMLFIYLL